jgi:Excalibur calcium-binding domain
VLSVLARARGSLDLALCAALALALLAAASGAAAASKPEGSGTAAEHRVRGCGAFAHQDEAQAYFVELDGSPKHPLGRLDPDHDGVACEGLPGPYAGYATLGYSHRDFFYGTVTMPRVGGEDPFPCMTGNTHFIEGPRLFNVYRVVGKRDRRLFQSYGLGAEARPGSGRLVWRTNSRHIPRGRYYVEFEERVRTSPYGENECPGFSSAAVELP